jgi:hypothetical protein
MSALMRVRFAVLCALIAVAPLLIAVAQARPGGAVP